MLVSDVDEDEVAGRYGALDSFDTALLLARAKSESVASLPEAADALVLGCDSVFEFDGESHGKPYEPAVARERLRRMSGSSGLLHTGHWMVDNRNPDDGGSGATVGAVATAAVHFAQISDAEIDAYVATGEPLLCAGSFTLDGLGGAFITRVDGDPHTIVGLSISTLRELARSAGVSITDLWKL